ncbi:MAG: hypothetical protein FWC13_10955 [Oscillospiraceae bacterium]|nr:hypothetical protein [Oscillospiraceae bacterium]
MLKEILKKLPSRIFYILFALVVSVALWMYIEITENEEQTFNVSNIDINFTNEDILRDRGWVPVIQTENLTLTFQASRADMARLTASGALSVDVNLANVQRTGEVQLDYTINWPPFVNQNAVTVARRAPMLISLHIDREVEVQIPVVVTYTGGTANEDLVAEEPQFEPQFITVRGSEEVVSRINTAYVPVLRESLSSTITEDFEFLLIDDYGEELEENLFDSMILSHYTVRVTIPIREMMLVPLHVELFHGSTTTELNTNRVIDPSHVLVSADPEIIRELNAFTLSAIDMTTFGTSTTLQFPIIIPPDIGIENISGYTSATVYITVVGLDIAYRNTSIIHVSQPPPGFEANVLTQALLITLRGHADDLAQIGSENIRVFADISELGQGTSTVAATIFIDGIDAPVDVIGSYNITVTISPEASD